MKTSVRSSHILTTLRRLPLALVLVLALPVQADGGLGDFGTRWQTWAQWWVRVLIAGPFGAPAVPPDLGAAVFGEGPPPQPPPTGSSCTTSPNGCNSGVHTTDPDGGNSGGGTSTPTGGGTGGSSGGGTGG